ncbi:hypothetical protein ILUMI_23717, partial [Ignelater luminosus]
EYFNAETDADDVVDVQAGNKEKTVDPGQICRREVTAALKKMKLGRAAGYDAVALELLIYMGEAGVNLLLHVVNLAFKKKGDTRNCSNRKEISLLSVPGKIYSRILLERLAKKVEPLL